MGQFLGILYLWFWTHTFVSFFTQTLYTCKVCRKRRFDPRDYFNFGVDVSWPEDSSWLVIFPSWRVSFSFWGAVTGKQKRKGTMKHDFLHDVVMAFPGGRVANPGAEIRKEMRKNWEKLSKFEESWSLAHPGKWG